MNQIVRQARKVSDVPSNLYVDTYLTDFSIAYRQDQANFVAPSLATPIPVNKQSGIYRTFPRGYFWRDEVEVRPLGGRPVQARYKTGKQNYFCEEWALETTIDDQERANAVGEFDLDESGVALLEGKQMIREDRIWAESFFKSGVWGQDYVSGDGPGMFVAFNDATSDPVAVTDDYKTLFNAATGFVINAIVLGANVAKRLRTNPSMVDRVKYTQTGIINLQLLAALFEVDVIKVARSVFNAADEVAQSVDETGGEDFQFIVDPDSMWMGYIEQTPRLNAPTAIARFGWNGLIPGAMNSLGGVITRGRDDRAYSDWIHSRNAFGYQIVASDLGIFLENASGDMA